MLLDLCIHVFKRVINRSELYWCFFLNIICDCKSRDLICGNYRTENSILIPCLGNSFRFRFGGSERGTRTVGPGFTSTQLVWYCDIRDYVYSYVLVVHIYSLCHVVLRIHRDTGFVYLDPTSWDCDLFMLFVCFVCVLCSMLYYIVIAQQVYG